MAELMLSVESRLSADFANILSRHRFHWGLLADEEDDPIKEGHQNLLIRTRREDDDDAAGGVVQKVFQVSNIQSLFIVRMCL